MLRTLMISPLCAVAVSISAQLHDDAAITEIAEEIVRRVGAEHACEILVLWTFKPPSQDDYVVRVQPDGEDCNRAMAAALTEGRSYSIRFETLDDIRKPRTQTQTPLQPPTPPELSPARNDIDQTPAPPFSFDLIDDRLDPAPQRDPQ